MTEWNKCPGCGITTNSSDDYCPYCGEPWTIQCPNCGMTWRFWRDFRFCPSCGKSVEKQGVNRDMQKQSMPEIGKPKV
jgi:membrane protease subunit (stomatin/prohibitin family)